MSTEVAAMHARISAQLGDAISALKAVKGEFDATTEAAKKTDAATNDNTKSAGIFAKALENPQQALFYLTQNLRTLKDVGVQVFGELKQGAVGLELTEAFRTQVEQTGQSFDRFRQKLRDAAGGTVSDFDLMQSASQSMSLRVTNDADQMAELLEIARFKARKFGIDTSQAFSDIVRGVGRTSPLILDNLGIVINAEESYKAYAESIGVAASALTDYQKKQAILNSVLAEGGAELDAAGGMVDSQADKFRQMEVAIENAKAKWLGFFAVLFTDLASESNPLEGIFNPDAAADAANQLYLIAKSNFAAIAELYSDPGGRMQETIARLFTGDTSVIGENWAYAETVVRGATLLMTGDVEGYLAAIEKTGNTEAMEAHSVALYDLQKAAGDVPKGTGPAVAGMDAAGNAALINARKVWAFKDAIDAVAGRQMGIIKDEPVYSIKDRLERTQMEQQGLDPDMGTSEFAFDQQQRMYDRLEREAKAAADAIADANRTAGRAASKAASDAESAAKKAAREAEKAAADMQKAWESAVNEVRSAVESAIDLSTEVGDNDFILRAMGLQGEAVNEAGRQLQDVINRGLESPWVNAFAELRGKTNDEVKATAAYIQDQINKFLRPDLLNRDAILQGARDNIIGKRNRDALVDEITAQLVAEGYAVVEAEGAIADQFGADALAKANTGGTDMVEAVMTSTQSAINNKQDLLKQLGRQTASPFIQGIIEEIEGFDLVDIVAQRVFQYQIAAQAGG